jgi:hypothetical protein
MADRVTRRDHAACSVAEKEYREVRLTGVGEFDEGREIVDEIAELIDRLRICRVRGGRSRRPRSLPPQIARPPNRTGRCES